MCFRFPSRQSDSLPPRIQSPGPRPVPDDRPPIQHFQREGRARRERQSPAGYSPQPRLTPLEWRPRRQRRDSDRQSPYRSPRPSARHPHPAPDIPVPTRPRRQTPSSSQEEQLPAYSFLRPQGHKRVRNPEIYPKNAIISAETKAALEALASPSPNSPTYFPRLPSNPTRDTVKDPEETQARELDLSRKSAIPQHNVDHEKKYQEEMTRRRYQRPWTLKEWRYVEKIQRNTTEEEMRELVVGFRRRFGWEPTEGQMRSQYWYFKLSDRRMRKFLEGWEKYEKGRNAGRNLDADLPSRMMSMRSVRPN